MNVIRVRCDEYCEIPALRSEKFSTSYLFPATNEFSGLLAPAIRSLGYSAKFVKAHPANGFTNLSDPGSLPSLLRASTFDVASNSVVMNAERFSVLNFTYPFLYEALSFFMKKPPAQSTAFEVGFLVHPFERKVWATVIFTLLVLFALSFLTQRAHISLSRRLTASVILVDSFVDFALYGMFCALYVAKLTATATTGSSLRELPTIARLTEKVESGEYALVVHSVVDFRFEFINRSENDDIRKFREALVHHPPIQMKNRAAVCDHILAAKAANDARTYFTIDGEQNMLADCGRLDSVFAYVAIPDQAPIMTGFALSPRVNALRLRVNKLVIAGFYEAEWERNKRLYSEVKRARSSSRDGTTVDDNSAISGDDISQVYWLSLGGILLSIFAWAVEQLIRSFIA